ncbi:MAG: glycosyltransferase family 87 protein [Candidatus Limnocylindrales bacterium]
MIDTVRLALLGRTALPMVAALSLLLGIALTLAAAGDTLGFDFLAYHQAAVRVLAGQPLYDMSFTETGGFGLFYYPPTFAPLILPLGLLSATAATWTWIGLSIAFFLAGVAMLPVSRSVRWWLILLAGWSFPFVYAVKLGQVGPILFGLFALGWRFIDEPSRLGVSGAVGAAIKLQPGLILVWALLTRRVKAVWVGGLVLGVLAVLAVGLTGIAVWPDFLTLLRTVTDPITTPHNFTPGAVSFQLGVPETVAGGIQAASTAALVVVFLVAIRACSAEASYLVAVIASQLVSPIVWDHYAMLLLLPVAYLLAAGRWWALAIPVATAWPLVALTPPVTYPVVFWLTLLSTLVVGRTERRGSPLAAASLAR